MPPTVPSSLGEINALTPLKFLLNHPLVYSTCSILAAVGSIVYVRSHTQRQTPFLIARSFQLFPGCFLIVFNSVISILYFMYISLCRLFFATRPSFSQHVAIGRKLLPYLNKVVILGLIIEPDVFDLAVWLIW